MVMRSVMIPLLGGAALLLGYTAFSWVRPRRPRAVQAPEALPDTEERAVSPAAHSDIGALFLGTVVDSLSPFSSHLDHEEADLESSGKVLASPASSEPVPVAQAPAKSAKTD